MGLSLFFVMCNLHFAIAITSGILLMFYTNEASVFGHGIEIASRLKGTTPHDEVLIQTGKSFSGLLLFVIGVLMFMVSFVKDKDFECFFAKGCVVLHVSVAVWRVWFAGRVEDVGHRKAGGDIALALSWVYFLVYTWREKYD